MAKNETRMTKHTPPPPPAVSAEEPEWLKKLRGEAKDERSKAVQGIPRLSHKGRVLKLDGHKLDKDTVEIVPLGFVYAKADFEHEYEEGASDTPRCFAFGKDQRVMLAHPGSPAPQNKQPDGTSPCGVPGAPGACPNNNFGTALKGGGKHCGDKVRVLFLLASDLAKNGDEELLKAVTKAQHYQVEIPATSISINKRDGTRNHGFNQYLAELPNLTVSGSLKEAITELGTEARERGGYFVTLRFLGKVPEVAMPALLKRGESAEVLLSQPYPTITKGEEKQPEAPLKDQGKPAAPKGKKR